MRTNLHLLIDTEAEISILKKSTFRNAIKRHELHTGEQIFIKGITEQRQQAIGYVILPIKFNDKTFEHKFHIVKDDFPLPCNGILGKDFIKRYRCCIDYNNMTFTVQPQNHRPSTISILNEDQNGCVQIPPRSESFKLFRIQSTQFPCVIETQQITDNILIPTTIVQHPNSWIRVLNTSEQTEPVYSHQIKASSINNYNIYKTESQTKLNGRKEKLTKILKARIPAHAIPKLLPLCQEYSDIFHLEGDKPSTNNFYTQSLTLNDHTPVYIKNYRLPQSQKEEIRTQVRELFRNDLIEMSTSNYNSPLIVVPKKSQDNTKRWRLCIDYKQLNKKLVPDKFPLPLITDIFDGLTNAKFFSAMDLQSGYHQIPLDKKSRPLTAFNTEDGYYQFKVLPFGLNIAPSSFTRMMTLAFSGLGPSKAFIYMDDLIVIGFTEDNHIKNLTEVFETCRKYNLKLNPLKCDFFKTEIQFLGHICTDKGLLPDHKKLNVIEKYPTPDSKEAAKRFVAFANYFRRFIPNFSEIAKPLNALSRKRIPFHWSEYCEEAFQKLKTALMNPPILAYPDFSKKFHITVDASQIACAGYLSQDHDGIDRPIAYISRAFTKCELNKPIIEKELIAIHFAITQFRHYVYGKEFTVFTDHKPLIYLFKMKNPSSKLTRIRLDLEEYQFEIKHISGKSNVVADALSRITIDELKNQYNYNVLAITRSMNKNSNNLDANTAQNKQNNQNTEKIKYVPVYEEICTIKDKNIPTARSARRKNTNTFEIKINKRRKQILRAKFDLTVLRSLENVLNSLERELKQDNINKINWPLHDEIFKHFTIQQFKEACHKKLNFLTIALTPTQKKIESKAEKEKILEHYHNDELYGGHIGKKRLYAKLKTLFYWKNMPKDIAKYCKNCHTCKLTKPGIKTKESLKITETPQKAFDAVQIDTVGPLPKSENNNQYVVTIIDELSKFVVAIPTPDKSAKTIATAIFEQFILKYGPMKSIRTDMGTEYRNELLTEICKLMKVTHCTSTAYHHQSLGGVERNHAILNQYLRAYVHLPNDDWENSLKYFVFCYNNSYNSTNNFKYTPFELIYGRKINLPNNLTNKIDPIYNIDNYALELKYRLQKAHAETQELIDKQKLLTKKYYDKKLNEISVKPGEMVKIRTEPYNKFNNIYSGPHKVIRIEDKNIVLEYKGKPYTIHKDRVLKY